MAEINFNLEALLVQRLRGGDKQALSELYNTYWQLLFVSAYNVIKDKELCEDIIQDVFMDIWHNREKLKINISLKGYLYACTRYQVFNQIKKNKNKIHIDFSNDLDIRFQYTTPETEIIHNELVQQINGIIESLPTKCQLVYKLSREERLSHKEIARRLDITVKTVENHITKALQTIRLSMGNTISTAVVLWISRNLF